MTETIAVAAIWDKKSGAVYSLPRPARHHTVMAMMRLLTQPQTHPHLQELKVAPLGHLDRFKNDEKHFEQGFVTSAGRFVGRTEAKVIAYYAGQLLDRAISSADLYSEDVW